MSDVIHRRPSSYLAGCMSPSCVPVHEEYSRIDAARSRGGARRLRRLIRRILAESRSLCAAAPKAHSFQYDAVSYSQNFDDGCHRRDDDYARILQLQHASRF